MGLLEGLSFKRRLTAITTVAAGGGLFLACAAIATYEMMAYRDRLVQTLATEAQIVGSNAASAIVFEDPDSAAATLKALRAEPHIVSAALYKPSGVLFAAYTRDAAAAGEVLPRAPAGRLEGHEFMGGRLSLYRPVIVDGAAMGVVVLEADLVEMQGRLFRYAFILLAVLVAAMAVAQMTASRLHGTITEPVLSLVETAKVVSARRDYSVRAVARGRDELGLLVTAFNDMLDQIQERDVALQRARDDLEGQVAERTRNLEVEIVERKLLEEALRTKNVELEEQSRRVLEATRLKSEFLANMSHELRTPLNAIIGFAELMHDAKVGPISLAHKDCLQDILTSSRHLLQLINDVLDLSKVEAGKMEFRPEKVDLARLVGEVRDILRGLSAEKRIRMAVQIDPALGEVVLDPGKLKQVLYNFLSNALKFTPDGGGVAVRARGEGPDEFRLEVEDTGIGIRPEDLPRLFTEFQQLDASASKAYPGTGLGLALTKRMVEAQGGRIGVSSTPGQGSVFFAVLPRVALVQAAVAPPPRRPALRSGPTLLVIEDDSKERAWLVETLSAAGYAVEVASSGHEALERCAERTYDGITLDLLLPDMGGWEVLKAIRDGALNHATPAIVVTVVAEKGVGAGYAIHDFLPKPVRAEDLLASLDRAGLRPHSDRPVLVVDDDPQARRLMETTLQSIGYAWMEAASAEEGLRMAGRQPPAAVILDLSMPGMDGFEFLEHFRGMPAGRGTPVIVWTVRDLTVEDQGRLAQAAQAVVMKGGTERLLEELRTYVAPPPPGAPGVARGGS
jgi:signal transduction histidine kinase/DNA-binding response OmpR family regulator